MGENKTMKLTKFVCIMMVTDDVFITPVM